MFSLWMGVVVFGANCKVPDARVATQLVEVQLAGYRLDSSPCRIASKFPLTKSLAFDAQEAPSTQAIPFGEKDQFEILDTQPEGTFGLKTRVGWKWSDSTGKPKESVFHWRRYTEASTQAIYGCAAILQPFDEVIVKKDCFGP